MKTILILIYVTAFKMNFTVASFSFYKRCKTIDVQQATMHGYIRLDCLAAIYKIDFPIENVTYCTTMMLLLTHLLFEAYQCLMREFSRLFSACFIITIKEQFYQCHFLRLYKFKGGNSEKQLKSSTC